jgi:hypothetical protein
LADQLTGTHQVTRKRQIRIKSVKVVPQPLGAYLDLVYTLDDPDLLADSRVLVIDPGFFSVDWVVIEQAALHQSLSGTSQMATSMILEAVQTYQAQLPAHQYLDRMLVEIGPAAQRQGDVIRQAHRAEERGALEQHTEQRRALLADRVADLAIFRELLPRWPG